MVAAGKKNLLYFSRTIFPVVERVNWLLPQRHTGTAGSTAGHPRSVRTFLPVPRLNADDKQLLQEGKGERTQIKQEVVSLGVVLYIPCLVLHWQPDSQE
jgi:hypothetical protein